MIGTIVFLHAVTRAVAAGESRAFYNARETPALDEILAHSSSLRLGRSFVVEPDNEDLRGPAGRVEGLLIRVGTHVWPPVQLPTLDAALRSDLIDAFAPIDGDPTDDLRASEVEFRTFLDAHAEEGLATVAHVDLD